MSREYRVMSALASTAVPVPGFQAEDEILARYAAGASELEDLGFYLALATFNLAAVVEGIHSRFLDNQTLGPGFEAAGRVTEPLLAAGLSSLAEHR